jgi:hypothetical protein
LRLFLSLAVVKTTSLRILSAAPLGWEIRRLVGGHAPRPPAHGLRPRCPYLCLVRHEAEYGPPVLAISRGSLGRRCASSRLLRWGWEIRGLVGDTPHGPPRRGCAPAAPALA